LKPSKLTLKPTEVILKSPKTLNIFGIQCKTTQTSAIQIQIPDDS
jgi:hypothetical protein